MKTTNYYLSIKNAFLSFSISTISLLITLTFFSSVYVENFINIIALVVALSIVGWLVKPFLEMFAKIFGIVGVLLIGFFGSAAVTWIVIIILPGVAMDGFWTGFAVAWTYALISSIFEWAIISKSDEQLLQETLRGSRKHRGKDSNKTGFIFIQFDGVSYPLLSLQLKAGNLPNVARLINDHGYIITPWKVQLPSTTPASQAGILHGNNDNIPAFRWHEKVDNNNIVANQADGAKLIEKRISNGRGLLHDGGLSVGNLFTGDAPNSIMVMSQLDADGRSLRAMREYTNYFSTPYGFMRSLILSVGEIIKEIYQAKRQKSQNIRPRVDRKLGYASLRAATNVLLRDLQTTIVIDQMMRGINSLYVDYLDYDEVAHHAGFARPESLASLSGMDKILGLIFKAKDLAPRPYEIVVVSDHGQSQGMTFKQLLNGKTLEQLINELIGEKSKDIVEDNIESVSSGKVVSNNYVNSKVVFTGSGNLGNIWLNEFKKRATKIQIEKKYPKLINGLLKTKGVGLLTIMTIDGPISLSEKGSINLKTKQINGSNPLKDYPDLSVDAMLKLASMKSAPDISVISTYNIVSGEVHAFEELVGNHGGSGGWQTEAFILHSQKLAVSEDVTTLKDGALEGAENVHKLFKSWLESAGHRK